MYMKKIFDLEEEITLMKFNNGKKGYENISGDLILFKDDKILGIMNQHNHEVFIVGKKRMEKIWIYNALDEDNLYNLTDNIRVYKKENKEYEVNEHLNFKLETVDFDMKKVDLLNRKMMNHTANKEKDTTNRALALKNPSLKKYLKVCKF